MKHFTYLIFTMFILTHHYVCGQLPNTSLFSFNYELEGDTLFLNDPQYLTAFNENGYNNQPSFFDNENLYINSDKYTEGKTEILRLHLPTKRVYRITKTKESEFSPQRTPDEDYFTTVRIEKNESDQSFWQYPLDRSSYGRRLLDELDNVGYYQWISEKEVIMFLVTEPISMILADVKRGSTEKLAENIGRCFRLTSNGELIFVSKTSDNNWYIKSYDPENRQFKIITKTLPEKEDFELLNDGSILMGDGSKLYRFDLRGLNTSWQLVDDLSDIGITNITRMARSPEKLIIVHRSQ